MGGWGKMGEGGLMGVVGEWGLMRVGRWTVGGWGKMGEGGLMRVWVSGALRGGSEGVGV